MTTMASINPIFIQDLKILLLWYFTHINSSSLQFFFLCTKMWDRKNMKQIRRMDQKRNSSLRSMTCNDDFLFVGTDNVNVRSVLISTLLYSLFYVFFFVLFCFVLFVFCF